MHVHMQAYVIQPSQRGIRQNNRKEHGNPIGKDWVPLKVVFYKNKIKRGEGEITRHLGVPLGAVLS